MDTFATQVGSVAKVGVVGKGGSAEPVPTPVLKTLTSVVFGVFPV
jgi:hypothetical protein